MWGEWGGVTEPSQDHPPGRSARARPIGCYQVEAPGVAGGGAASGPGRRGPSALGWGLGRKMVGEVAASAEGSGAPPQGCVSWSWKYLRVW